MADYLILQVQFDVHMIASPHLPGDARQHPKLLAPLNSSDWNDKLAALRDSWFSLLIFQVLLCCRLFTALFSFYWALASVWKPGVYHMFTCMVTLNSNFISTSSSTSNSSALTPFGVPHKRSLSLTSQFAGLSGPVKNAIHRKDTNDLFLSMLGS